jgi:hypothetical protein
MANTLDQLTVDGSIPDEVYRLMRDAIQAAEEERGHLFKAGHEPHYQAIAVFFALKAAGYSIQKLPQPRTRLNKSWGYARLPSSFIGVKLRGSWRLICTKRSDSRRN